MKHYGDITKINGALVEPVNVVIGGSPCQDLSVAGKQAGLAGERSGLFIEQLRIIKEMRRADLERGRTGKDTRPRYMVWENVPGAFSSNKGADFGIVLQETAKVACEQAPAVPIPKNGWPPAGCLTDMGGQWSIDLDANGMETEFQAAFEDLLFFINAHLANTGVGNFDGEDVTVIFNRDILINETEAIDNCGKSKGIISDETIMKNHPWIDDVEQEAERLKKEKEAAAAEAELYPENFGGTPSNYKPNVDLKPEM